MVDVLTETVIERPSAEVAAFATDPDNAPRWYRNISSVVWQTPKPLAVGSRVAFSAQFLGRQLDYVYEISELVPGRKLVMRTAQGPFPMQTTYTWTAAGPAATQMTLRNTGEPAGFSRLAAAVMAPMMRAANRRDLRDLKRILEA
ncbi:SRPBCC family protein [Arthrobacter mobilis]|uniref:ATPase n=1 Tax=Arthrobacter mobilis TaxID=2724944 RepID=A0A7X6HD40_9MICC|nr:SRPBCC family protein [Arthrobacter mobilis]NKX54796.1 ATPase [Arthrobacter mobilis]